MNAAETGKRIAALRHRKGWTQQQLAAQLHITDKAVSKWERGLNFPDLGTVEPLAAALDTSPAALLGLEQEPPDQAVAAVSELAAAEQARIRRSIRLYARVTLAIGVLPYLAFDGVKIGIAAALGPGLRKRLRRAGVMQRRGL